VNLQVDAIFWWKILPPSSRLKYFSETLVFSYVTTQKTNMDSLKIYDTNEYYEDVITE
jgi:hypothetical protein